MSSAAILLEDRHDVGLVEAVVDMDLPVGAAADEGKLVDLRIAR